MSEGRKFNVSPKTSVEPDVPTIVDDGLRRSQTGKSHALDDCEKTDYFCRKCGKMKFRCAGCGKIVCFCEKRNNHIVGDTFVFCLPPLS